jgi:CheY-like chemotaxis protein
MISILLVDDSNDKVANIIKVIREISDKIIVDVVIDFVSAQHYLISSQYDLLILDINLPIRVGEESSLETGKNLLNEINRKSSIQSPFYIISLTQYSDECSSISDIWQTIKYSPESIDWKTPIVNLIKHIEKCNFGDSKVNDIKPTIFLEGKTDEKLLAESISIFKPELADRITLRAEKNAGATWVARQLIVWSYSLKKSETDLIKAIGLLDGDQAGKEAQDEINRVVRSDSAASKTFKTLKLSPDYARHIIPIKKKGLDLPVTLEEMFTFNIWLHAKQKNWLVYRNNSDQLLTNPNKWNKFELSLKDYLNTLSLTEEENLYLYCFKDEFKEDLVKYILSLELEQKRIALCCFEKLVNDISDYFFKQN